MMGSGLIFELPVLVFILSIFGLLTPAFMSHYRRHALVVILVISAFITPPDPVSLILMSIPLILGASVLKTKDLIVSNIDISILIISFIITFLVSLITIKLLIRIIKSYKF